MLAGLFAVLPARAAYGVGWLLAVPIHFLFRWRVGAARSRLRAVFGEERSEREIRRIAWLSWLNLCYSVVELLRLPRITPAGLERIFVDLRGIRRAVETARAPDGGLLVATVHSGNWDLGGVACRLLGLPVFFIARRQKNPLVDAYLVRMRGVTGADTVLNDSGMLREIIRRLRAGQILAILPDVRAPTPGVQVDFLGGVANVGGGAAMCARHAGVPIVPAVLRRDARCRLHWIALDPLQADPSLDKATDRERMTRELFRRLDQEIRRHPESYFWYNKRWVLDPLRPADPPRNP